MGLEPHCEVDIASGDDLPKFLRRNRHRQSRGFLPSVKLDGPAYYTTFAQRQLMRLLELTSACSKYMMWPLAVELPVGREATVSYAPAIGVICKDGRRYAIDIIHDGDAADRAAFDIDQRLEESLSAAGWQLLPMAEAVIVGDKRLPVAQRVWQASKFQPSSEQRAFVYSQLSKQRSPMSLGRLREAEGDRAVLTACWLVMKGDLRINLATDSLDACSVSLTQGVR